MARVAIRRASLVIVPSIGVVVVVVAENNFRLAVLRCSKAEFSFSNGIQSSK